jgi:hypothetical protein
MPDMKFSSEKMFYVRNEGAAGTLPEEIYDGTLNWWRSGIRRVLLKSLRAESRWIGHLQVSTQITFSPGFTN